MKGKQPSSASFAKISIKATILVIALVSVWCGYNDPGKQEGWDLNGTWDVFHIWWTGVVIDTTNVDILQADEHIAFIEVGDTISTGCVVVDTIFCTDMYGLGLGRIFIYSNDHLRSEIPMCESSNGLEFVRRSH